MSERIHKLLEDFKAGDVDAEEVVQRLVRQPYEEHLIGRFDQHRETRTGVPEVIFSEGKEPDAVADIFRTYLERGDRLIASRVTPEVLEALDPLMGDLVHFSKARIVSTYEPEIVEDRGAALIVTAGALDVPVAEEAAVMSELMGNPTKRLYDVGVAGVSRLASHLTDLDSAHVIIVVAGMDGVLPSLVGGLAKQPIIAVPTSVGYGAAFEGLAPLLTMLNSCSAGIAVMNINNGFGAAMHATKILKL